MNLSDDILNFPESAPDLPEDLTYNQWLEAIKEHHKELITLFNKKELPESVREALYAKIKADMDQASQIWKNVDKNRHLMERFLKNWEILNSKFTVTKEELL